MSRESYIRGFMKVALDATQYEFANSPTLPLNLDHSGDIIADRYNQAVDLVYPFIKKWEKEIVPKGWDKSKWYGKAGYDKVGGKWTIGNGLTTIYDKKLGKYRNVREGDTITQEENDARVKAVLRANASKMYKNLEWSRTLSPRALAKLMDVGYNCGINALYSKKSPNLNKSMANASWLEREKIGDREIPTYRLSNGTRYPGLENRRKDSLLYFGGPTDDDMIDYENMYYGARGFE